MRRRKLVLISSAGPLLLFLFWLGFSLTVQASMPYDGLVVAHRGASGDAPENTMAAFDLAVSLGSDFIEIDVRMSKDGQLVVIHDETLDRTTNGQGLVNDYTLEELKALDAGSYFDPAKTQESIPTLEEVLERYTGQTGILIELKDPPLYPDMEQKTAGIVTRYMENGNIVIQSFHHESMRTMHALLPEIPIGVLISEQHQPMTVERITELSSYATYFNYNFELLDERMVKAIHALNRKVMSWTIRENEQLEQTLKLGVDGIITDYPGWFDKANKR
ncbi:glycerophosphodiester phosphodiesterase [Paenibacillus tarimensis]